MTATIRPAHPRDTAALARLKLATFRETFIDGFAIPYPPDELALFEEASYAPATVAATTTERVARLGASWPGAHRPDRQGHRGADDRDAEGDVDREHTRGPEGDLRDLGDDERREEDAAQHHEQTVRTPEPKRRAAGGRKRRRTGRRGGGHRGGGHRSGRETRRRYSASSGRRTSSRGRSRGT